MTTAQVAPATARAKPTKRCTKCRETKPVEEFYSDKSREDGLGVNCKECKNAQLKEQRARAALADQLAAEIEAVKGEKSPDELVVRYWQAGFSDAETASKVEGYTPDQVRDTIAVWKTKNIAPETREVMRQRALLDYDELFFEARAKGDIKEARLCIGDKLRAAGIVQQGGNTMKFEFNQTNNVLESRLEAWAEKNGIIEGEVVPQLTGGKDDSDG